MLYYSIAGSQVVVLVQNKGESNLQANVAEENSGKGIESEIPKKKSKLVWLIAFHVFSLSVDRVYWSYFPNLEMLIDNIIMLSEVKKFFRTIF